MKSKPTCCWDCGTPVIEGPTGALRARSNLRQVRFVWSHGPYNESTFCKTCAESAWNPARVEAFRQAVIAVAPEFADKHIVSVDGARILSLPIAGLVQ